MQLSLKEQKAREKLCIALDGLINLEEIESRISELKDYAAWFKIGKACFTRFGPEIIKMVHKHNKRVFLDMKYHDIPNTVKETAEAAADMKVELFNVHASGGSEMMKAAVKASSGKSKIVAVTVLTSLDDHILNNELCIKETTAEHVLHLAKLAEKSGCYGIVCSALDLPKIRDYLPKDFFYVTPGIELGEVSIGKDQKRTATPGYAIKEGSSLVVVGRAISMHKTSEERKKAAKQVLGDMAKYI